jgi:hypothetical protein
MSFMTRLHEAKANSKARAADPWRLPLERARGKIGDDGIERITTLLLFDILEVPQRSRGAGAQVPCLPFNNVQLDFPKRGALHVRQ